MRRASLVAASGLSCPEACGILVPSRNQTHVPCPGSRFLTTGPPGSPLQSYLNWNFPLHLPQLQPSPNSYFYVFGRYPPLCFLEYHLNEWGILFFFFFYVEYLRNCILPLVIYQAFWHNPINLMRSLSFSKVLISGKLAIQENNRGLLLGSDFLLAPERRLCLLSFMGVSGGQLQAPLSGTDSLPLLHFFSKL